MVNMDPDISVQLYKNLYCLGFNTSSKGTQKILQKKPYFSKPVMSETLLCWVHLYNSMTEKK